MYTDIKDPHPLNKSGFNTETPSGIIIDVKLEQ